MKCLVLYAHPPEPDGQSLQGDFLYHGLLKNNHKAIPCHFKESYQKEFYLKYEKPDVAFGIGFWGIVPEVITEPLKYGVKPVPWFNADGWVANYQKEFNELDLMFTTSKWVRDVYERDGIDVSNVVPMHIGIDTDFFKPTNDLNSNNNIRKLLGIDPNEKIIMTIGGDTSSKGSQEMLRALAEVNKEFKNWKYICKSWPSDCADEWREKEIKLAKELGIRDKVLFVEDEFSQEFMVPLLNAADIYAAPSRIEGFGMIQVEAMACADERFLAVQLTNILPEIFKNLSPDKMFIMGDGNDTFGTLSRALLPFLQLLPEYSDQIKKFFGNGGMKEVLAEIKK